MAIRITPIGEIFVATVTGIELTRDIAAADLAALLDASCNEPPSPRVQPPSYRRWRTSNEY